MTAAQRRFWRGMLRERMQWLQEKCECGDVRRDHLSGHGMCSECPCREFQPGMYA